jgi:hypothetical protein
MPGGVVFLREARNQFPRIRVARCDNDRCPLPNDIIVNDQDKRGGVIHDGRAPKLEERVTRHYYHGLMVRRWV